MENPRRPLVIGMPGFGEAQLARRAVKQRGAEFVFQITDLAGHRRRHETELTARCREAPRLDDSGKDPHRAQRVHESTFAFSA